MAGGLPPVSTPPALFICGELDTVVPCDGVANTFRTVTDQSVMS